MKHALGWIAAIVVPLLMLETSLGHYAARSVLFFRVHDLGAATSDVATMVTLGMVTVTLGMLASAVLSAGTGPAPAAAAGLVVAAGGHALAVIATDVPMLRLGVVVAGLGWGLHRPAMIATAARWLASADGLRAAALIAAYALVNAGAVGASLVASAAQGIGSTLPSTMAAAGFLVAALVLLGLFGLSFVVPPPDEPGSSERFDGRAAGIAVAASVLGSVVASAWFFGTGLASNAAYSSATPPSASWALVNPAVVVAVSGFVGVAALVAHVVGVRPPLFLVAGLGAWAWAAALGAAAVLPGDPRISDLIGGVGEVLFYGGMFAAVTRGVYFRLLTVPIAVITAAPYVASTLANALADSVPAAVTPLVAASALACVPLGAALVGLSIVLERPVPTNPDDVPPV